LKAHVEPILSYLFTARPTAVNLGAATRRLRTVLGAGFASGNDTRTIIQELIAEGKLIADEDLGRNKEMAKWGGEWLLNHVGDSKVNVLTVCNTGSLATSVCIRVGIYVVMITHRMNSQPGLWYRAWTNHIPSRNREIGQGLLHANCALSSRLEVGGVTSINERFPR
jgi:methylthioribose-1-phosphate isomerase